MVAIKQGICSPILKRAVSLVSIRLVIQNNCDLYARIINLKNQTTE